MSWLSSAARFVYSGIFAQAARAASSSSPAQSAAGKAALASVTVGPAADAIKTVAISTLGVVASDIGSGIQAHNSPTGIANAVVGDVETALKAVVDGYVGTLAAGVPLLGGLIAPEAIKVVNLGLDFGEQHALTFIAALFAHHRAVAAGSVAPASAVAAAAGDGGGGPGGQAS